MNLTARAIAESVHPCFYFHNMTMHHAAEPKLKNLLSIFRVINETLSQKFDDVTD